MTTPDNLREVLAELLARFDNVGSARASGKANGKNAMRQPGTFAANQ